MKLIAVLTVLAALSCPVAAQEVRTFSITSFGCPNEQDYDAYEKAFVRKDYDLAANVLNRGGCDKYVKGDKYIETDRKGALTFRYRKPGSMQQYWTTK